MRKAGLKIFDYIIIVISIAVIVVLSIQIYSREPAEAVVKIDAADGTYIYPLDEDREITVDGPIGQAHIVIEDGSARISESPCEDQLCVLMGSITRPGEWAACLPNRVFISIEGGEDNEEIDILSY